MREREKQPVLPEEKFTEQVEARSATWLEMIDESPLSDEDKQKVRELIEQFRQEKFDRYNQMQDSTHHLARNLLDIFARYEENKEAQAIFTNLRADIWDFYHELNNI